MSHKETSRKLNIQFLDIIKEFFTVDKTILVMQLNVSNTYSLKFI